MLCLPWERGLLGRSLPPPSTPCQGQGSSPQPLRGWGGGRQWKKGPSDGQKGLRLTPLPRAPGAPGPILPPPTVDNQERFPICEVALMQMPPSGRIRKDTSHVSGCHWRPLPSSKPGDVPPQPVLGLQFPCMQEDCSTRLSRWPRPIPIPTRCRSASPHLLG